MRKVVWEKKNYLEGLCTFMILPLGKLRETILILSPDSGCFSLSVLCSTVVRLPSWMIFPAPQRCRFSTSPLCAVTWLPRSTILPVTVSGSLRLSCPWRSCQSYHSDIPMVLEPMRDGFTYYLRWFPFFTHFETTVPSKSPTSGVAQHSAPTKFRQRHATPRLRRRIAARGA